MGNLPSLKSSFLFVKEMVTAVLAQGDVRKKWIHAYKPS